MSDKNPTIRSGVYAIRCLENGKVYIGSAVNFRSRWRVHRCHLSKGTHHSQHLQFAWNKYGADRFIFEILETVLDRSNLIQVEQAWLDRIRPFDRKIGYNLSPTASSCLGYKATPKTRAKLSAIHKKRLKDPAERERLSDIAIRQWQDPEYRARFMEGLKNSPPEAKIRSGETRKGRKHTPQARAKMRESMKMRVWTLEAQANLIESLKKRTPEWRANVIAANKRRAEKRQTEREIIPS